ncbi:helix-turn-helix domain-containing protein [Spirosoma utsteinense]|uniref:helix-turn-helix domain-containing protein n=1 Tax=Spirosoma utsteinense TaxID=2585773 RepID=UPI001648124B|nr:helix-turn-helix transcriptional regulator [Spirosoma utsteinense]MBC3788654.1 transcriptional regulator with XRE-family HTH domain [Spirosoma utsteinense]
MGATAKVLSVAFGRAMREERLNKGLSQEELAFRCNLDRTYISSVERGKVNPSIHITWLIAVGLDVSLWVLIKSAEELASIKEK